MIGVQEIKIIWSPKASTAPRTYVAIVGTAVQSVVGHFPVQGKRTRTHITEGQVCRRFIFVQLLSPPERRQEDRDRLPARVREDLADIINFALEELVRQRFELPTFATVLRAAQKARATVNRGYYARVTKALDQTAKEKLDRLFTRVNEGGRTSWDLIKSEPKQPTAKEIKRFVAHLSWLREASTQAFSMLRRPILSNGVTPTQESTNDIWRKRNEPES